ELRQLLDARPSGGIIFTTIQKFSLKDGETRHPSLNARSNIVVISDEAHRSHYGLDARLDSESGRFKYGYARHLRDALENATFIGFTGTPISTEDRDTRAVFGDYVSIYDIQDAVEDGATVPIYYESRLAKLDVNQADIEKLEREVDDLLEDDEEATREKTKGVWTALEKLVGAAPRLDQIADDLVRHFEEREGSVAGKAMIVCMSRDICVALYNRIVSLRPAWHSADIDTGAIKVIMTGSAADKEHLQPHLYTRKQKKRIARRFKNPDDPLKLVIVCDMWLTGFDVPPVHTMYIDKPMRRHNLMQAIARVNRVFKDKPGGLVVDYIGIANELKAALKDYTESKGRGTPTNLAGEALPKLFENLDIARSILHGFDYGDFETDALELLLPAVDYVLRQDEAASGADRKRAFLDAVTRMNSAMALCGTLDEAEAVKKEVAFLTAVKAAIMKWTDVDRRRSEAEKHSALRRILDNSLVSEGVEDVFKLAGLERPNISLLDERFLEDVRNMKARNLAVELLEKLLKDEISTRLRRNLVQEKKYSERLLESIRKYRNRAIETAQVIEELIQMAKDMRAAAERDEALGLNPDETAFYDALADNESAVRELGDDTLKKIAAEITEKLRKSTVVDWQKRESVRAKLRILVRRTLQKWKYPPDKQDAAVELVLKQAEGVAEGWAPAL
ncbi:MAG TPA: type I restriction endonuclease subunit R, partial [Gammaproteobacteria bacterium]|nr:type I restriction endonuclease subunit R [Gammaproteobacteria bacterium]